MRNADRTSANEGLNQHGKMMRKERTVMYSRKTALRTVASWAMIVGIGLPGATAWAQAPPAQTGSLAESVDEPETIELGDGRFMIALDPDIGIETPAWLDGAVEWEYVGQAILTRTAHQVKLEPTRIVAPDQDPPTDTIDRLLASEMVDEHGRMFMVKSVDLEKLEAAIAAYDAMIAEDLGFAPEIVGVDEQEVADPDLDDGVVTPVKWYREDQDGDGVDDRFRWNSDGRGRVEEPLTERQKKVVILHNGSGGSAGSCSGVLVGRHWVLTCAHCAKTDPWTWIHPLGEACTRGAGRYSGDTCSDVIAGWSNGEWSGSGDPGDDIVILKLRDNIYSDYMPMSQASNSTLKDHAAFNIGYPGLKPSGSSNRFNCSGSSLTICESWMYWDCDEVNKTSTKKIGTKCDISAGHSGGPIFYYPSGASPSAAHYLTGLMAVHHQGTTKSWNGGPKIPYHRDWVVGVISSN